MKFRNFVKKSYYYTVFPTLIPAKLDELTVNDNMFPDFDQLASMQRIVRFLATTKI